MDFLSTIKDVIMILRKENNEKKESTYKYNQELRAILSDYYNKIQEEKRNDEYLINAAELAIEGLELLVNNEAELLKLPYLYNLDKSLTEKMDNLIKVSRELLQYYENEYDYDYDDPSREIIDMIISFYEDADKVVLKK